jgi:Ca2+/Na+ antiporter
MQTLHIGLQPSSMMDAPPERFAFFPTLSRSHSDLTRNRKGKAHGTATATTRNSNNHTIMTDLSHSVLSQGQSPRSIENFNRENNGYDSPELDEADLENAQLLGDDVEDLAESENNQLADTNGFHRALHMVVSCIYVPVEHVLRGLLPALHPQVPHFITGNHPTVHNNRNPSVTNARVSLARAVLVLLSSITAIGVLAVMIVLFCESVITQLGLSSTTMGATLVALGAEVCAVLFSSPFLSLFYLAAACALFYPHFSFFLFNSLFFVGRFRTQ